MNIDPVAKRMVLTQAVVPECLHVPIAAVDEDAIADFIGDIVDTIDGRAMSRALLVRVPEAPHRDARLPIWDLPGAEMFFRPLQVWVDISYTRYRQGYRRLLPDEDLAGKILSHAMNRRIATMKGFNFVRLTPISRSNNSSSAFSENWGVSRYASDGLDAAARRRRAFIQYADIADLMLMADLRLGGGVMDLVNDGQALVRPPLTKQSDL